MLQKNFTKWFAVGIFTILSGVIALAQNGVEVTGTVIEAGADPLIGVTVVQKGMNTGATVTDEAGNFTIEVTDPKATLVFYCLGMETEEVALNGRTKLQVNMRPDTQMLEETVVIGYGTAKRSDLTGSVSSISKDALSDKLITNMEDALRGKVAGVRIISNDGAPGEELNIRIRGAGSLNASNSPIYVIDGLVSETADVAPGDIESIEILKDASATAIYGSKGSNGVVIITTKRGSTDGDKKISVTFETTQSLQEVSKKLELMNSYEFASVMRWASYNYFPKGTDPTATSGTRTYFKDAEGNIYQYNPMNKFNAPEVYLDPTNPNYVNSDWQSAMMRKVHVQEYRINISGGDKNSKFSVLGGYYDQPGILVYSGYNRYSIRTNYEYTFKKGGNIGVNLSGLQSKTNGLNQNNNGTTMSMLAQAPTKPLSASDWIPEGNENKYENRNPLYQAKNIKRQTDRKNMNLRLYINIPFLKDFRLSIAGNFSNNEKNEQNYFPKDVQEGREQGGKAINNVSGSFYWNSENLLYYTPTFKNKNHKFDAMVGFIVEQTKTHSLSTESHGFDLEEFNTAAMQDGKVPYSISSSYGMSRMMSFLGRVNYSYKNYYFTATFRGDGCSRFGPDNKWGFFPSGAFMWRISDEPFMKNARNVNNLKFRISVGATGNASIPSLQSLATMTSTFYPTDGSTSDFAIITDRPANWGLKWESLIQTDAAIEFGFFRDRLSGVIEVYNKETTDLLFERPVPYATGYKTQWSNIAAIRNSGLELTLNGVPVETEKVSWDLSYNMAFNKSNVRSLGGASEMLLDPASASGCTNIGILRVGKPLGNWYGYKSDGVWQSQREINELPDSYSSNGIAKSNLHPGSTKLVDQNGDGTVNEKDRVILGNAEPIFTGGLSSVLRFYNFTFTLGFEFSYGGKIFNATARELTQMNSNGGRNLLKSASNYWTPTLYDITTGEMVYKGNEKGTFRMPESNWENILTDQYLEDASYLRLDNIALSYTIPAKITRKFLVDRLSVNFSVRNAFVLTNYTGYDPDVSVAKGTYSDMVPKLDAASFPRSRSYTLGLSITF